VKKSVHVRVPATTANLGPGFDTLGIALNLHNQVELSLSSPRNTRSSVPQMVREAARLFFSRAGLKARGFEVSLRGEVPVARGLGSSVAVRLGVVAGLNHLLGKPFDRQGLLEIVSTLEGHPDNAAPAVYGGLTVSGKSGDRVTVIHRKLPAALKFVAAIPDFEVRTGTARRLLPRRVPFADAVHNVNRAALLVAALWDGRYREAGDFLEDRLHQPARAKLVPQLFPALRAAKKAGAIGGWLSGSGSTIMALTLANTAEVGRAMRKVFERGRVACEVRVMEVDNEGFCCH